MTNKVTSVVSMRLANHGVVRLEQWPEGLALWLRDHIVWKSWEPVVPPLTPEPNSVCENCKWWLQGHRRLAAPYSWQIVSDFHGDCRADLPVPGDEAFPRTHHLDFCAGFVKKGTEEPA